MFKKICTRCVNTSYSSTRLDNWQCPYCGDNLNAGKAHKVDHNLNYLLTNKRLGQQRGEKIYKSKIY